MAPPVLPQLQREPPQRLLVGVLVPVHELLPHVRQVLHLLRDRPELLALRELLGDVRQRVAADAALRGLAVQDPELSQRGRRAPHGRAVARPPAQVRARSFVR